jgi:hypothetical protein
VPTLVPLTEIAAKGNGSPFFVLIDPFKPDCPKDWKHTLQKIINAKRYRNAIEIKNYANREAGDLKVSRYKADENTRRQVASG